MTKKIYSLLFLVCCFYNCQNYKTVSPTLSKQKVDTPIELTNKRVLILGNSITHNGLYVSLIEYALRKENPNVQPDIISIGLGSETVSGLTEPDHPFPRPNVLDRLDKALAVIQPDLVIATYGMNDGIYHPPSPERLVAYQNGMQALIKKVKATAAELILVTPTPFDALPIAQRCVEADAPEFGYKHPYRGYDQVLGAYSNWLNTLDNEEITVVDWHTPINKEIKAKRIIHPPFTYAPDGVHPNEAGHLLMAQLFLKELGLNKANNYLETTDNILGDSFFEKTHQARVNRSERWRNYIGYTRGKTVQSISPKSLLILMGGQSNMSGLALKSDLENSALPKNINFIDYGLNGQLKPMEQQFGPEYGLAKQLNEKYSTQHFTFLKYSIGGASLLDWAPEYNKEKAAITKNSHFGNVFAKCFHKVDSLTINPAIEPTAFLWMQGERDARIPEAGKDYYDNFKKLIQATRQRLGQPDLPFIFGMVNPPKERYAALDIVRKAQRQIAKDIPNVFIIETDDLAKLKDKLHYNKEGQLELGKRFGQKVNQFLEKKK